jgi:short-subunit dehydrogenase
MFETARAELIGTGVSVLMVCPSFVATGIVANAMDASGNRTARLRVEMGEAASPDYVAGRILTAVRRRRRFLVLSATGRAALLVSRLAPGLYERFIHRRFADEL